MCLLRVLLAEWRGRRPSRSLCLSWFLGWGCRLWLWPCGCVCGVGLRLRLLLQLWLVVGLVVRLQLLQLLLEVGLPPRCPKV